MTTQVTLTSDIKGYAKTLRPGDVLLFDSARPLSGLIKFGENRPVNHSGLFIGHGQFAEATSHSPTNAVRANDLEDFLDSRRQRTSTAFRHVGATVADAARIDAVVDRANAYTNSKTSYAYRSLYRLILPSLYRSYRPRGPATESTKKNEHWLSVLGALANSSLSIWGGGDPETGVVEPADGVGFTCSEFVYRCFVEEPDDAKRLDLEVIEPLSRLPDIMKNMMTFRGSASVGVDEFGAEDLVFHESLSGDEPPMFQAAFRGPAAPGPSSAWSVFADIARTAIKSSVKTKWLKLIHRDPGQASPGVVVPDTVTPRDLWSSPSLQAVAVFHRPPSPLDTDLDDEI